MFGTNLQRLLEALKEDESEDSFRKLEKYLTRHDELLYHLINHLNIRFTECNKSKSPVKVPITNDPSGPKKDLPETIIKDLELLQELIEKAIEYPKKTGYEEVANPYQSMKVDNLNENYLRLIQDIIDNVIEYEHIFHGVIALFREQINTITQYIIEIKSIEGELSKLD